MSEFPQVWLTDESPPRRMIAKGYSAMDPDVIVAYFEGGDVAHWIVEASGYVCGLSERVHAKREQP